MNGMEILLQTLGLDPEQIRATIATVQAQFVEVNTRLERMEAKLNAAIYATFNSDEEAEQAVQVQIQKLRAAYGNTNGGGNSSGDASGAGTGAGGGGE